MLVSTIETRLRALGVQRITGTLHAGSVTVDVHVPSGVAALPWPQPTTVVTGEGGTIAEAVEDALGKVQP